MLLPQGLHLAGSQIIQIKLLDPPLFQGEIAPTPIPKVEQTSNQPQEYLLKSELFSRTNVVKPRKGMTGSSRTVVSQPLILLWQAAVQNAYFRHRNRSRCPNYLFSKSFSSCCTEVRKNIVSIWNDTEIRKSIKHAGCNSSTADLQGLRKFVKKYCHILHRRER